MFKHARGFRGYKPSTLESEPKPEVVKSKGPRIEPGIFKGQPARPSSRIGNVRASAAPTEIQANIKLGKPKVEAKLTKRSIKIQKAQAQRIARIEVVRKGERAWNGKPARSLMTAQAVGAYGEKVVEAELLRLGWLPANVNASVKNAADFDIFAQKGKRAVYLRVKACGPTMSEFQFSVKSLTKTATDGLSKVDFTVLVNMGATRNGDEFYIVPTSEVREAIRQRKAEWLSRPRRDGLARKDVGMWVLRLQDRQDGADVPGYGMARKWKRFSHDWTILEKDLEVS